MKGDNPQSHENRSKTQEMQLQQKYLSMDKDFKAEKEKLFNISTDMNRQYKQMQDELLKDINELNATVQEKDEIIKTKEQQIMDHRANYEERLKKKDQDIAELRKKIDDMSLEFADMLKETLNKMQERITKVATIEFFQDLVGQPIPDSAVHLHNYHQNFMSYVDTLYIRNHKFESNEQQQSLQLEFFIMCIFFHQQSLFLILQYIIQIKDVLIITS